MTSTDILGLNSNRSLIEDPHPFAAASAAGAPVAAAAAAAAADDYDDLSSSCCPFVHVMRGVDTPQFCNSC